MKEWIEELLAQKRVLLEQQDLLLRLISYVDQEHGDDTPILHEALKDVDLPRLIVDNEGVRLAYDS